MHNSAHLGSKVNMYNADMSPPLKNIYILDYCPSVALSLTQLAFEFLHVHFYVFFQAAYCLKIFS